MEISLISEIYIPGNWTQTHWRFESLFGLISQFRIYLSKSWYYIQHVLCTWSVLTTHRPKIFSSPLKESFRTDKKQCLIPFLLLDPILAVNKVANHYWIKVQKFSCHGGHFQHNALLWKVSYSFAVKRCAGVICSRLSPTLKSCKENCSAEENKERSERKENPQTQTMLIWKILL